VASSIVVGTTAITSGSSGYILYDNGGKVGEVSSVGPALGGTGVANNAASTTTIVGAYPTTWTLSGPTSLTLPTSGTLETTASLNTIPYDGDWWMAGNADVSKMYIGGYATASGTLAALLGGGDFCHWYFDHNVPTPSNGTFTTTADYTSTSYSLCLSDAGLMNVYEAPATGVPGNPPVFVATPTFSLNMLTGAMKLNGNSVATTSSIATALPSAPSTSAYVGTNGAGVAQAATATSWFDSAYCNSIGYLIVRWTGAWTCSNSVAANPVWWGADPTGSADSAAAINSALAANSYVQFPAGIFKVNSGISYLISPGTKSVTIIGAGQDNTILNWPNNLGGIAIGYNSYTSSVHIRDLTLTTSQTTGSGSAIWLNYSVADSNPAIFAESDITRVTARGNDGYAVTDYWQTGVSVNNVSNVNFTALSVFGPSGGMAGNGVTLTGLPASATYAVVFNFVSCNLSSLDVGLLYGSYVQGVVVASSNFTGDFYGIDVPVSETGNLSQLTVVGSQFATNSANYATSIEVLTVVTPVQIIGNFFLPQATLQEGIVLNQAAGFVIADNVFDALNGVANNSAIEIGTVENSPPLGGIIHDNQIYNFNGTNSRCILLDAASASVMVHDNYIYACTLPVVNSGAVSSYPNVIYNNTGYNPVGAASISTGGSPFTYKTGSSPETDYWSATTITGVTEGGVSILPAALGTTDFTTEAGPNETFVITYTGTLVGKKMVH
jgi:hypothetical protein